MMVWMVCAWESLLRLGAGMQVNDSYRGTLSSYCYVLMCIHLLQQREPPILPCLQAIKPPTHFRCLPLSLPLLFP